MQSYVVFSSHIFAFLYVANSDFFLSETVFGTIFAADDSSVLE
jgi:hypothetical protein